MAPCSCSDMRCVLKWKNDGSIPFEQFEKFLLSHGIVKSETCRRHGGTGCAARRFENICWKRWKKGSCRKRLSLLYPYMSCKQKKRKQKFSFWVKLCQGVPMSSIASQCEVDRKTAFTWKKELLDAVYRYMKYRNSKIQYSRCQVDETYLWSRKYNRGRRTRKKPTWVLTLTEVARNGKSVSTVWLHVKNRNKETLEQAIRKHTLDSQRTIVTTDGWKGYSNVIAFRDHRTVNHSSKGKFKFVTADGTHTNNAESCHSAVKRAIRKQGRLSMSLRESKRTVALFTLFFKKPSWQEKLQVLLCAFKVARDMGTESDSKSELEEDEVENEFEHDKMEEEEEEEDSSELLVDESEDEDWKFIQRLQL